MTRSSDFSLRRLTVSSAIWYGVVVAGWPLILIACWRVIGTAGLGLVPAFCTVSVLVAALELLPLVQGRGHDPQGVVMSMAFAMAMVFVWGVWPAVVMVCIGSVGSDLRAHKNWWKVAFNPAQYGLSLGAAYLIVLAAGQAPSLTHPANHFVVLDLWWMALACIVYHLTNLALVGGVMTYVSRFWIFVRNDFRHATSMSVAVLGLSPLIVVLGLGWWPLIPLLLIPLLLIYRTAQLSLEREHAAGHDALTDLPNRSTLSYRLDQAFAEYERDGRPFALMLIDLDDFKAVNDALGHHAGDELLRQLAERLGGTTRDGDLAARLGGDEFAVVLTDVTPAQALAIAQRTRGAVAQPVVLDELAVEVELSVGLACCPRDATDAETLLRFADLAMYHAKADRTGVADYSPDLDGNSPTRLGLVADLRHAIEHDELRLWYQPKLAASDRRTIGVEALARWEHERRGSVSPDQFIPAAEQAGIMPLLTAKVLRLAVSQMAAWKAEGLHVPTAVNISATDLLDAQLPTIIAGELALHDLPATMLKLEITERIPTAHLDLTRRTLEALRAMGVGISLDDFGTGYSSLLRLGTLPVDEMKIDKAFVSRLCDDPRALDIIGTLVVLAHALGAPAIVEGVETEEQLHLLEQVGCDGVQGWYIARPMPSDVATEWIRGRLASSPLPAAVPAAITDDESGLPSRMGAARLGEGQSASPVETVA